MSGFRLYGFARVCLFSISWLAADRAAGDSSISVNLSRSDGYSANASTHVDTVPISKVSHRFEELDANPLPDTFYPGDFIGLRTTLENDNRDFTARVAFRHGLTSPPPFTGTAISTLAAELNQSLTIVSTGATAPGVLLSYNVNTTAEIFRRNTLRSGLLQVSNQWEMIVAQPGEAGVLHIPHEFLATLDEDDAMPNVISSPSSIVNVDGSLSTTDLAAFNLSVDGLSGSIQAWEGDEVNFRGLVHSQIDADLAPVMEDFNVWRADSANSFTIQLSLPEGYAFHVVPEPSTLVLAVAGCLLLCVRRATAGRTRLPE